jgi:NAD(P)-dependent dehydrogenase (short-subunit alcohol dehydrogenase family)
MGDRERAALVTGGGSGIGYATAEALVERGVDVLICGRRERLLRAAVVELSKHGPGRAAARPADLATVEGPAEAVAACVTEFGGIDLLVNNAGIAPYVSFQGLDEDQWDLMLGVTVRAAALAVRAATASMTERGGGRIVNVASVSAEFAEPGLAHYSAAKAALISLTRSVAVELATVNIQANTISPGYVRTPMTEEFTSRITAVDLQGVNPLGRVGEPAEIARVAEFLLLDAPDFLTGQNVVVDGGQSIFAPPL